MQKYFKIVGFSDHSLGIDASKISLQYGVKFIEKHYTIDKKLPGRDNKFAILPNELLSLKKFLTFYKHANNFRGKNF